MALQSVTSPGSEDFISKLPNGIRRDVLERLPIRDAVKTTVLSSRWNNLWTSITSLHFDEFQITNYHSRPAGSFVNFVDQVLAHRQDIAIQNFGLFSTSRHHSHVETWILYAVEHNVCHLDIHVTNLGNFFCLPQSILTCTTLTKLRMRRDFAIDVPDSLVCFPNLKILRLELQFPDGNVMKKLSRKCPVLEELHITGFLGDVIYPLTFNIIVPTLLHLSIDLLFGWDVHPLSSCDSFGELSLHEYVITTPNLEYLNIVDPTLGSYVVSETPLLRKAFVDVGPCWYCQPPYVAVTKKVASNAMDLLKGTSCARFLSLSFRTMLALNFAYMLYFPTFPDLIHLELCFEPVSRYKLLPHFLKSSPTLEVLILKKAHAQLKEFSAGEEYDLGRLGWSEPEIVPNCLLRHVKEIKMNDIMTWVDEDLELVKYLLKTGQVLEKFSLNIYPFDQNLQNNILLFPRASEACEIEFHSNPVSYFPVFRWWDN